MKVLFLAANPLDMPTQLRTEIELREIKQKIRGAPLQDEFQFVPELAVRAEDLQTLLMNVQPDIVHFSGHCDLSGGIMLEDKDGYCKVVSRESIAEIFGILKGNIRLVVLNACYAKDQAQALTSVIDFAIGMNTEIEDRDATIFSSYFYQSLAFGYPVQVAFSAAVSQLKLTDSAFANVPELLARDPAFLSDINPWRDEMKPQRWAFLPVFWWRAFLPVLLTGIAVSLITDVVRRFAGNSGWTDTAMTVIQFASVTIAAIAAILTLISIAQPSGPQVRNNGPSDRSATPRRATLLSAIAMIFALGLWLSLPALAHYYNERGAEFQYREQPDLTRAREAYQRAVRLNSSYAQAYYNLATVEEDWQPEGAIEAYLLAIRCDSRIYPAYNNLARLYLRRGTGSDDEDALRILNQASDLSPQDANIQYSLNKNLGWANYALKHYPLAETFLRRAISLNPQGAAAHCLLAYVLKVEGKTDAADECFDCVRFAPGEQDVETEWLNDAQNELVKGEPY